MSISPAGGLSGASGVFGIQARCAAAGRVTVPVRVTTDDRDVQRWPWWLVGVIALLVVAFVLYEIWFGMTQAR